MNDRTCERLRLALQQRSRRVLDAVESLGISTPNRTGHPLVHLPVRRAGELEQVGHELLRLGVFATLAAEPLVPQDDVGVRLQLTSAHTEEQVERLLRALGEMTWRFRLASAGRPPIRLVRPPGEAV